MLDALPIAVVVIDAGGAAVYRNPSADNLLAGADWPAPVSPLERARAGESFRIDDLELCRAGEAVPFEAWVAPVGPATNGERQHVAAVLLDVAERRRTEQLLADVHAEVLRKAAALERSNVELETFAYVASHDLSEPLRVISGYAELLARRYRGALDDEADEFIDFITDGCVRMRQLIDDLLQYSRLAWKDPELAAVDCTSVATAAMLRLQSQVDDTGATITVGPLPTVLADAERLTALFQNLLSNAVKFRRTDAPSEVAVTAELLDGAWVFTVADNGIGIEPELRERAFGMFRRLHPRDAFGGTGIGLALCRKIVERHNGRIWIEGEPGKGTRIRFTLGEEDV